MRSVVGAGKEWHTSAHNKHYFPFMVRYLAHRLFRCSLISLRLFWLYELHDYQKREFLELAVLLKYQILYLSPKIPTDRGDKPAEGNVLDCEMVREEHIWRHKGRPGRCSFKQEAIGMGKETESQSSFFFILRSVLPSPAWLDPSGPQKEVLTLQFKQMAKFASGTPFLLWSQIGSCCLCEPPFLLMPRAGNSSQSQVGGAIRCDGKQDAHGTPTCLPRGGQVGAFEKPQAASSHTDLQVVLFR